MSSFGFIIGQPYITFLRENKETSMKCS